jgi:hypothetical protein
VREKARESFIYILVWPFILLHNKLACLSDKLDICEESEEPTFKISLLGDRMEEIDSEKHASLL